jgi:O-antigen ligase
MPFRKDNKMMRTGTENSDSPIQYLVVSWVLMIPLFYVASFGNLWFHSVAGNNYTSMQYGALVSTSQFWAVASVALPVSAIVIFVAFPQYSAIFGLFRKNAVFGLLTLWAVCSVVWSQSPTNSLRWSLMLAMNTILVFYLFCRFSQEEQVRLFLLLGWICVLFSLVLCLFFPAYGVDQGGGTFAWRGMYPHKNMCSMVTLFLLPTALFAPAVGALAKVSRIAYVCLSVFLIIMTQSATGRIGLGCLLFYLIGMKLIGRFRSRDRSIVVILASMITLSVSIVGLSRATEISYLLGKNATWTGRTDLWGLIMPSLMKHPILGYGYKAFWMGYQGEASNVSSAAGWAVTSAHNAYLEVWITLGAVGLGLVVYSLVRALRDAWICFHAQQTPARDWYICLVFLSLVMSLDEGEMVGCNNLLWLLYILACVGLSEGARSIRLDRHHG